MFAHLVTAAKGLFTREESQDALADLAGACATTTPNMVFTTRQEAALPEASAKEAKTNGVAKHQKRKAEPATIEKSDDKQSKRRKRNSLDAADATDDNISKKSATNGNKDHNQTSAVSGPKKHFRFDSEEPFVPEETQPEEAPQASSHEDEEEDSDDDAPETIDNSAQLLKLKEQAKKQEKARQV